MYKLLLISKYLRKRRIAWVSLLAVMMCTTMVIVVMSVMGGWLNMFREGYRGLTGDIIISRRSWSGFPYYDEMIKSIEALPGVKAAVPTIQTFGLINVDNQIRSGVQVIGYPIDRIGLVNRFPQSLYWQYQAATDPTTQPTQAQRAAAEKSIKDGASFKPPLDPETYRRIKPKRDKDDPTDSATWPGMIVGDGVIGIKKELDGSIEHDPFLHEAWASLTVMGLSDDSATVDMSNKATRNYWLVDDSRTKIFAQDENAVYVPFDVLQGDLHMNADEYTDADTGGKVTTPARTSNLQVSVKPGVVGTSMIAPIQKAVEDVFLAHGTSSFRYGVNVETWEQVQAGYINAIEHEIVLTTLLFAIISIVAVFLIFCIFYMIVQEKTRDIGIIKSLGATGGGVATIFLGYGLAIGILGGGLGLLVSYLIVHNINELHTWIAKLTGVPIFTPETYMFDSIPNTLDPTKVSIIVAVAVVSSVVGSVIPALRAARMNPVEALRFE